MERRPSITVNFNEKEVVPNEDARRPPRLEPKPLAGEQAAAMKRALIAAAVDVTPPRGRS